MLQTELSASGRFQTNFKGSNNLQTFKMSDDCVALNKLHFLVKIK